MQQQPIRLLFSVVWCTATTKREVLLYEERLLTEFDLSSPVQSFHNCVIKCMCFSVNVCFNNLVVLAAVSIAATTFCEFIEPTFPVQYFQPFGIDNTGLSFSSASANSIYHTTNSMCSLKKHVTLSFLLII